MQFTVVTLHPKAVQRSIHEAVLISRSKAQILLDNKSEWTRSQLPRIEVTNRCRKTPSREEEMKELE